MTCLSACDALFCNKKVSNNSKGCGGIMRAAPVGLMEAAMDAHGFMPQTNCHVAEAGAYVAELTHCHPLGFLPAALLAVLVRKLVTLTATEAVNRMERLVEESIAVLDEVFVDAEGQDRYLRDKQLLKELSQRAIRLAQSDVSDAEAIAQLGEGWVADEAWAIALYCSMRHVDSVRDAIIASVNHDGDSDSTGSITGNIMGAIYGYKAIKEQKLFCPEGHELEQTLELSDIILALADDLRVICLISEDDFASTPEQQWYERYCKMRPVGIGDCRA